MRVVTFNIQHGRTPAGRVDVSLVARACRDFEADVIGLQEVDVRRPRSGWVDTVRVVRRATGLHGVFGPAIRGYGNALLSTAPITDVSVMRLPRHGRNEPRSMLLGRTHGLLFGVVHLSIDEAEAHEQLAAAQRRCPDVLMGDFNLRGEGDPTWPADNPRIRIDHVVALTEAARVTAARVLPAPPVSDHRPLCAEVTRTG